MTQPCATSWKYRFVLIHSSTAKPSLTHHHSLLKYLKYSFHVHHATEIAVRDQIFAKSDRLHWLLTLWTFGVRLTWLRKLFLWHFRWTPTLSVPLCRNSVRSYLSATAHPALSTAGQPGIGVRASEMRYSFPTPLSPPLPHAEHASAPNMWLKSHLFWLKHCVSQTLLLKK